MENKTTPITIQEGATGITSSHTQQDVVTHPPADYDDGGFGDDMQYSISMNTSDCPEDTSALNADSSEYDMTAAILNELEVPTTCKSTSTSIILLSICLHVQFMNFFILTNESNCHITFLHLSG